MAADHGDEARISEIRRQRPGTTGPVIGRSCAMAFCTMAEGSTAPSAMATHSPDTSERIVTLTVMVTFPAATLRDR